MPWRTYVNGESVAAIGEDDEDVGIFFAAFTFVDIFLSTIINNVRETIDTIERMTVGTKSEIVIGQTIPTAGHMPDLFLVGLIYWYDVYHEWVSLRNMSYMQW